MFKSPFRAVKQLRSAAAFLFSTSSLILAGCSGHHTGGNTTTTTEAEQPGWAVQTTSYRQATKPWTFLVYMDGANNLDTYGLANVNQMEQVGSTGNLNIVVQFKRGSGYDANSQYTYDPSDGGWSGTRRYYINQDGDTSSIKSTIISTNGSVNMGDPASLQAFIHWGIAAFPAQHYALVVWDHGSGWRAEPIGAVTSTSATTTSSAATRGAKTRGVAFDDVTSDYIKTTELTSAVDMGSGRKWDLFVFDASLMQMAEVAYQLKDKAQYVLGSEESPPGGGYPYDQILADLNANPTWTGRDFGADIAQKTFAFYLTAPTIGGQYFDIAEYANYVTQSLLDTSQLAGVSAAFNNLGAALQNAAGKYGAQIAQARDATENYGVHDLAVSDLTYPIYVSYRDGIDFTNQLLKFVPDAGVQSPAATAQSALKAAIVVNYHGSSHARSNGLALYIPSPSQYRIDDSDQAAGGLWYLNTANNRYTDLAFTQAAPNWQSFLVKAPE